MKILVFLLCFPFCFIAQTEQTKKNSIQLDLGGVGGYAGLHLENKFFQKSNFSLNARFGFSTYKLQDYERKFNPTLILPASFILVYGKKFQFELGTGITFSSFVVNELNEKQRKNAFSLHQILSIRLEKEHWLYKLSFTPMMEKNKRFRPWFGFTVGKKLF